MLLPDGPQMMLHRHHSNQRCAAALLIHSPDTDTRHACTFIQPFAAALLLGGTQIDGTQIKSPPDISRVLDELQIGKLVQLKVLRAAADGKEQQEVALTAVLASE